MHTDWLDFCRRVSADVEMTSQHGKGTDDALVLVARYRGGTRTSG